MNPAPVTVDSTPHPLAAGGRWSTDVHFWLSQEPYADWHAPHTRARWSTGLSFRLEDGAWVIRFACQAGPPAEGPAPRPVGDPDIWQAEFVQVLIPYGTEAGCIHFSVTRAGAAISERHDKRLDPVAGWTGKAAETADGWQAELTIPAADIPSPWQLRFARWTPDEGLTRWPTPYGSWWSVWPVDFLEIRKGDPAGAPSDSRVADYMREREASVFTSAGTSSDPAAPPDFLVCSPISPEAFLERMRGRVKAQPFLAFGSLPPHIPARCQSMLANTFWFADASVKMEKPFDWDNPHGRLFELGHMMRFDFFQELVAAWRDTGDLAYGRKIVEVIESWLAKQDLRQNLTPGRYRVRWSWLNLPHRLVCAMQAVYSLIDTGLVSGELLLRLHRAAAETLWTMDGANLIRHYPKNHSIIIADHGVQLSVLCPDLVRAARYRDLFFEHFRRAIAVQFLPDDVQWELSTGYHMVCYKRITEATSLCEQAGIPVPADITDWLRRILNAAGRYLLPNGEVANFNDGGRKGTVDAIGRPLETIGSLIAREAADLGADEALAIASHGEAGMRNPPRSHAMAYAGHFILRDGLAPDSMALAFDAGPLGKGHAHEDALGIILAAFGKTFLVDLGSGAYDERTPMRRYSTSTESHSTIMVDGQPQASRLFPDVWARKTPLAGRHYFGRHVQFVAGEYTLGYGAQGEIGVQHRRAVLVVDRSYVIVIDHLSGPGAHRIESRFVLNALPYAVTAAGLRTTSGSGDLDIQLLYPGGVTKEVACGSETPYAGWLIRQMYGQEPAPRLTFEATQALPACWITLLTPFREAAAIPMATVAAADGEIRVTLRSPGSTASLVCSTAPWNLAFSDERGAFKVETDPAGLCRFSGQSV
jgi:hypothetical protein